MGIKGGHKNRFNWFMANKRIGEGLTVDIEWMLSLVTTLCKSYPGSVKIIKRIGSGKEMTNFLIRRLTDEN